MLRIGIHRLPAVDAAIVKLILNADSSCLIVDNEPFDGLVTDGTQSAETLCMVDAAEVLVLKIVNAGQDRVPGCLARPIRKESLRLWVARVKEFKRLTEIKKFERTANANFRYKLIKWPLSELLADQHQRYRIAAMLCRKALTIAELSQATSVPVLNCKLFLDELIITHVLAEQKQPYEMVRVEKTEIPQQKISWITHIRHRLGF